MQPFPPVHAQDTAAATGGKKNAEFYFQEGRAYAKGEGKPLDPALAAEAFRKAAEMGHAKGQNNYASMLMQGSGVPKNETEAFLWFQKAANGGAELAQLTLGRIYEQGRAGQKKDPAEALVWYEKSAAQGNLDAQYQAAALYYFGDDGVKRDYAKACLWAEKAVKGGHAGAENLLGSLREDGLGCPADLKAAVVLYSSAAEKGDAKAQSNLGRLYLQGRGVEVSVDKAYPWLVKSAFQMEITAIRMLDELAKYEKLNPKQKSEYEYLSAAHDAYVAKQAQALIEKDGHAVRQ